MSDPELSALLRPRVPVPVAPRGFMELERYSTLKRLWDWLEALHRQGYEVRAVPRVPFEQCRRAVLGLGKIGAGGLLDSAALVQELGKDEQTILEAFNLEPEALRAVNAFLEGDRDAMKALLNRDYRLEFAVQLGFTARRELLLKAEARFMPLEGRTPPFPTNWALKPVRWGRDDYRQVLDRAASGLL